MIVLMTVKGRAGEASGAEVTLQRRRQQDEADGWIVSIKRGAEEVCLYFASAEYVMQFADLIAAQVQLEEMAESDEEKGRDLVAGGTEAMADLLQYTRRVEGRLHDKGLGIAAKWSALAADTTLQAFRVGDPESVCEGRLIGLGLCVEKKQADTK